MSHKYHTHHLIRIAAMLMLLAAANALQYSSNMFLNGDYENGLAKRQDNNNNNNKGVNDYRPGQSAALASLLSKRATPFVGQMYLPTLLECKRPQQCVPKDQCINGYFRRQLPNVQFQVLDILVYFCKIIFGHTVL
uniref:Uncharacterized protein n=1 Tax=Glossina brevipalpis TaxID=37001 RepID=A0A1A9WYT2_9MUSC